MKKYSISLTAASVVLGNMVDFKNNEVVKDITVTGDIENISGKMDLTGDLEGIEQSAIGHGIQAVASALAFTNGDNEVVALDVVTGNDKYADLEADATTLSEVGLDLEYFEPSDPSMLKPFTFSLAVNSLAGDAGLDQMYPTVNIPANVEGALLRMPYGFIKSKFSRDDAKLSGETRLNNRSILSGLRNPSIVNSDANLLVPVSNAANDAYLDIDFKTDNFKHPTTGELITTAPIKFDSKLDLTTIAYTAKLVSEGVFADETSLDIGGSVTNVYGTIGDDKFKFDISSLPMNEIIAGGSGDNKDLVLNIATESFVIDPANIKMFDGAESPELATLPAGTKLVYALDINGNGNEMTCDFGVRKPTIKLIKVLDAAGNAMDMTDGDGKAASDVGVKLALTGYDLYQTVTNADLRIIANVIDVGEFAQRIGVGYGALDSYERTILSDKKPAAAETLLAMATIRSLTRKRDLQLKALKKTMRDAKTSVNGGRTKNLTSTVIDSYNEETSIDLAAMLDSNEHGERFEDIAGLIAGKIASVIPGMIYDTNYTALTKVYGRSTVGVGITFGTNLLPFMPANINIPGIEVKMAVTEIDELKSDIFIYPMDTNHSTEVLTPLNFGVRLAKPDLVVSGKFDKIQGTFIVPRNRVETIIDILHTFKVTNLTAAMEKVTLNTNTI